MNNILIDNYRGFDIEFNTTSEKFQCVITDNAIKESISFSAVKKFIDDYKKDNNDFKPFYIEGIPDEYFPIKEIIKIIGIRKDGRFISENNTGVKRQISDYDLKRYMVFRESNKPFMLQLDELKEKENTQRLENNAKRKEIKEHLTITTLYDYKKEIV